MLNNKNNAKEAEGAREIIQELRHILVCNWFHFESQNSMVPQYHGLRLRGLQASTVVVL